ncbi:unnamed protein product [Nezara viridula]|uniref:GTP-binding protein REM 1 n=1 Tax=Nezara viridula TaxID=85310 RepID=A0A9P0E2L2_NEZVI|nr:unnamed protein product [Nezara viridula]
MSERRGSVCEVTSPEGHTTLIEEGEPVQPPRRRPRDLTHLAHSKPGASPTDIGAPPASPVFKFPPLCRRSTSDLTTASGLTEETLLSRRPSSPRGLGYLASRRASRESVIAPLRSNYLQPPVADHQRPRVCSLPEKGYNPRYSDDLYRLRNFSITAKGVVNYGDSIIDRRSRSNTSINSTASSLCCSRVSPLSPWQGSCCSQTTNISTETMDIAKYRIVLLGESGVGKTALVSQFMTSEYMNTYDASLDDEFGEKTVSILLDGEESEMVFIDHPSSEMSVENSLSTYEPHAAVVVYSVVDRATFKAAEEILNYLWRESYTQEKTVILVGNKVDLARARVITNTEGKSLAASRDCKYIETSSGIQHNVDELLVGILKQIRLRETREKKKSRRLHSSRTSLSLNMAKELLQRICLSDSKSKSCENLHVL